MTCLPLAARAIPVTNGPVRLLSGVFGGEAVAGGDTRADDHEAGDRERRHFVLVSRAQNDEPDALEDLARHVLRIAQRTAAAVVRDSDVAQEVAQEVAIDALRGVKSLRNPGRLDAWVYRMSLRRALRVRDAEARRRRSEIDLDSVPEIAGTADLGDLAADEVSRAVGELPARQRAAIILRYVHDMSEGQIARMLGCRPGTAGALLSRGRATLRKDPRLVELARELGIEEES